MKLETRGKYPGVKVHLDPEEVNILLAEGASFEPFPSEENCKVLNLAEKMAKEINKLLKKEPTLLTERTPEQIAAILAKEVEAATLKLERMKAGKDWKKIDPAKLQEALNKHVKKD